MTGYTREIHAALDEARFLRQQATADRQAVLSEAGLADSDPERFSAALSAVLGRPHGDACNYYVDRSLAALDAGGEALDKITEDNWFVCDEVAGQHEHEHPQPVFLPNDPQGSLFDRRPLRGA